MTFPLKKIASLFSLSLFLLLTACSKPESANQNGNLAQTNANQNGEKNNSSAVKDDIEELGKIIKLPVMPEETTWREDSTIAPPGKKLTAVVKFSAENAAAVSRTGSNKPTTVTDIDAETWFPAELIAKSQLSGDESLKGVSFPADDFLQAPYNQGKITRINDTNYFVFEFLGK
jgi:hypothetical protein